MVRIRGFLIIRHVARHARCVRRGQVVVVVDMALCTGNLLVQPSEREPGLRMIKLGVQPGIHGMAGFACRRETAGRVIWVRRLPEVSRVAREALGGKTLELAYGGSLVTIVAL